MLQHEVGEALQALWLWPRSHKIVRDQRGRSWRGPSFASLEVDHSFLVVDVDNLPCSAPGLGIMRRVVYSDGVVLGREAKPVDGRARLRPRVWPRVLEGQLGEGIRLLAALFVGELVP